MIAGLPSEASERSERLAKDGGESGIRTHGRVSPTHAFQACSFNHSDISPSLKSTICERPGADYRTRRRLFQSLLGSRLHSASSTRTNLGGHGNCVRRPNVPRPLTVISSSWIAAAASLAFAVRTPTRQPRGLTVRREPDGRHSRCSRVVSFRNQTRRSLSSIQFSMSRVFDAYRDDERSCRVWRDCSTPVADGTGTTAGSAGAAPIAAPNGTFGSFSNRYSFHATGTRGSGR